MDRLTLKRTAIVVITVRSNITDSLERDERGRGKEREDKYGLAHYHQKLHQKLHQLQTDQRDSIWLEICSFRARDGCGLRVAIVNAELHHVIMTQLYISALIQEGDYPRYYPSLHMGTPQQYIPPPSQQSYTFRERLHQQD